MKKARSRFALVAVVVAPALVACGVKDPEEVCKKYDVITAKMKEGLPGGKDSKKQHDKCVKEMTAMKSVAPDTYKKISKCAGKSDDEAMACILSVAIADPEYKKAEEKARELEEKEKGEQYAKIADAAAKPTDVSFKTSSGDQLTVTVSMPDGMEKDAKASSDSSTVYKYKFEKDEEYGDSVDLDVSAGYSVDVKDAMSTYGSTQKAEQKEANDSGYVVWITDEYSIRVKTAKKLDDSTSLECSASANGKPSVAQKDKLFPWLQKLCTPTVKERVVKVLKVLDLPLKPVDLSVKSYSGESFSFSANWPDGMTKDKNASDTMVMYQFKADKDDDATSASLTITTGGAPNIEDETKYLDSKTKIDKKDARPDGFTLATSDEYSITVKVGKAKGEGSSVECSANMFGKAPAGQKEKLQPWLEKLCTFTMK